jgi:hypothetical protein
MLLDPDTPFLEIAPLAALDLYDNAALALKVSARGFSWEVRTGIGSPARAWPTRDGLAALRSLDVYVNVNRF